MLNNTSHILMIRPARFEFNAQTAVNNAFQVANAKTESVNQQAVAEFDGFVSMLQAEGVNVKVVQDSLEPHTPDSIFPNNWFSTHGDGIVVLYPMFAENRRKERSAEIINGLRSQFLVNQIVDLTGAEKENKFLEGTGSMVLDRNHFIAYACLSPRTHPQLLRQFEQQMGYRTVAFQAVDQMGNQIYHTNVLMCVASQYVVICMDAVKDESERKMLRANFENTQKEIIEISYEQMNHFAGNMLQVNNGAGERLLIMSTQAYQSLHQDQIEKLEKYNAIQHAPLDTIETNGGGSARCMMAEIFLPLR